MQLRTIILARAFSTVLLVVCTALLVGLCNSESTSATMSPSSSTSSTMSQSTISASPSRTGRHHVTPSVSASSNVSLSWSSSRSPSHSVSLSRSSSHSPSLSHSMSNESSSPTVQLPSMSLSSTSSAEESTTLSRRTQSTSKPSYSSSWTHSPSWTRSPSRSSSPSTSNSTSYSIGTGSRTISFTTTVTSVTPVPPPTLTVSLTPTNSIHSPSESSTSAVSFSWSMSFSRGEHTATTTMTTTTSLSPTEANSVSTSASADPSLSPTVNSTPSPTPDTSMTNTLENRSFTITLSPEKSASRSRSLSNEFSSTYNSHSPSQSRSMDNISSTPSESTEFSSSMSDSMFLLPNVTMVFDVVWGTPMKDASPVVQNPSEAFEIYSELDGAVISHDSLRASAFVVYFHIREEVTHRFFAAAPPVPVFHVGPSVVTNTFYPAASVIGITMSAVSFNRFENRQFVMRIGPAPSIRINEPFYFNVTVRAHPSLVDPSLQEAIASTAAAVSVIFFHPLGSLIQSRAVIMTTIVVCQDLSENNLFSILNVGVGDVDVGYFYRGAIAGNFGIVAMSLSVPVGVSLLSTIVARPKRRQSTWQRCCEIFHLPTAVLVPAQLMIMPTVASSVALAGQWRTHTDISVGATGLTLVAIYLSFLIYSSWMSASIVVGRRTTHHEVSVLAHPMIEPVWQLFSGSYAWVGRTQRWKSWKRQYYYLFGFHDRRSFLVVETVSHTVVACLAGVVIGDKAYCTAHHVAIALLSLIFMVIHIAVLPLLSLANHVVMVLCYGLWTCAAVCAATGMLLGYGSESTTLLDAATICNLLTMCFVIMLAVPRAAYMVLILRRTVVHLWGVTEYRVPRDPEQPKPYDVRLLPAASPDPIKYVPYKPKPPPPPPPAPMPLPPPPKRKPTVHEMRTLHSRDLEKSFPFEMEQDRARRDDAAWAFPQQGRGMMENFHTPQLATFQTVVSETDEDEDDDPFSDRQHAPRGIHPAAVVKRDPTRSGDSESGTTGFNSTMLGSFSFGDTLQSHVSIHVPMREVDDDLL